MMSSAVRMLNFRRIYDKRLFTLNPFIASRASYSKLQNIDIPNTVLYESSIHKKDKATSIDKSLPSEADVVVIGGGSIGCSTIYHLSKLCTGNVILLENHKITSGTTWHTAGILYSLHSNESQCQMQLQTKQLISEILPKETGEDASWLNTGRLITCRNSDLYKDVLQTTTFAKACGVEIIELGPKEIHDIHPLVNVEDVYGAVYSPGCGTLDPATYCMSYIKSAQKYGAKVFENCRVTNITTKETDMGTRKVSSVETTLGTIKTNIVVNCTGAWAPYLGKMVGVKIPQATYKHAYVVTKGIPGILNTPIVRDQGTVYIKPQGDALLFGGYERCPSLIEDLSNDFSFGLYDFNWDVFEPHMDAAINRIPSIADVGIRSTVCGPESFSADGKPNIGESAEVRGFFVGSAFSSGGMMLGGGAGRQLAHWVIHGKPEIDMTNCDIRRYPAQFTNYNKWLQEKCHSNFQNRYTPTFKHNHASAGRNQRMTKLHQVHARQGALFGFDGGFERPAYYVKDENGDPDLNLKVMDYDYDGDYDYKKHEVNKYKDEVLKDCILEFPEKSHRLVGRECLTCRTSAALFDQSYFSKFYLTGLNADRAVKRLLSRDMTRYPDGLFLRSLLLNRSAGIEGDVVATRVKDKDGKAAYYLIGATSGEQHLYAHIQRMLEDESIHCNVENRTDDKSILSVQGPKSADMLQPLIGSFILNDLKYREWRAATLADKPVMLGRFSSVGEVGFELHCDSRDIEVIYEAIMQDAAKFDACLAGYRAMDSLSAEIGSLHWPREIKSSDNPIESRLITLCDNSSTYLGSEELRKLEKETQSKKLACFTVEADVPIYGQEVIWRDGEIVGYLRAAEFAYALGCNIGYGYVTLPEITDDVMLRGNYAIERMAERFPARIHTRSPFDKDSSRLLGKYSDVEQHELMKKLQRLKN